MMFREFCRAVLDHGIWPFYRGRMVESPNTEEVFSPPKFDVARPKLVDYKEAGRLLALLIEKLDRKAELHTQELERHSLSVMSFLCRAAKATITELNDANVNVPVFWSETTGFPSSPTLVADAMKYAERHSLGAPATALLNAFIGWQCFLEEKMLCCCGSLSRQRFVNLQIMVHHRLTETAAGILEFQQLVGVRADDKNHLAHHYGKGGMSGEQKNLRIIGISVSEFKMESELQFRTAWQKEWDENLNLQELVRRIETVVERALKKEVS